MWCYRDDQGHDAIHIYNRVVALLIPAAVGRGHPCHSAGTAVVSLDTPPPGGWSGSDTGYIGHTVCTGSPCTHILAGEPVCLDAKV